MRLLARPGGCETVHEERWRALHHAGPAPRLPAVARGAAAAALAAPGPGHRHRGERGPGRAVPGRFAASLGYRAVRGSSTRGGARALLGAVRELRAGGAVAFTPDGPRGPRRELKPGVVAAAQRGGGVIVPIHAEADRAWRLHSWDRFMIPKPFARVTDRLRRPSRWRPGRRARRRLAAGRARTGARSSGAAG